MRTNANQEAVICLTKMAEPVTCSSFLPPGHSILSNCAAACGANPPGKTWGQILLEKNGLCLLLMPGSSVGGVGSSAVHGALVVAHVILLASMSSAGRVQDVLRPLLVTLDCSLRSVVPKPL